MMMEEMFLVVVATDDPALNRSVAAFALERNILVNVVDDPEKCNFIVPSTLKRGDLLVSVTTSGRSPALSRRIRRDLEHIFPESLDEILDLVSAARDSMKASLSSDREREAFWREFFSSPIINDWEHLRLRLEQILKE
jgi:precorrin-2 dehydrogenase/sirohydrochlorin ferrochelatase